MFYVEAPEREFPVNKRSIFLAGTITGTSNWQKDITDSLSNMDIVVLNPRRKIPESIKDSYEQIQWEFDMLRHASIISFWFAPETVGPITLYELGAHSMTSKPLLLGVDPKYQRIKDIQVQTKLVRPEIDIVYSLPDLINKILEEFSI